MKKLENKVAVVYGDGAVGGAIESLCPGRRAGFFILNLTAGMVVN